MSGRGNKIGLTLGKYAPFHRGHQYVIDTALREMDEVAVIIYDAPGVTDIPLPVRASWIRRLYPQVRLIEAWDGPEETGYTPEIKRRQERYALGLLDGLAVTHFYSSEPYGEHMSEALGAVNRTVDLSRLHVPVSATAIRAQPYELRAYVDPLVYRDMIAKIVFLGAPSTGKTTLAAHMAERHRTVWMPEYGREYWERNQVDRRLSPEQLVELAGGHLEREERLLNEARQRLFVDTNAITTYMFSLAYHGMAHPRLEALAAAAASRYDLVFLCGDDIPYDDTWDRSGETDRAVSQKKIAADLQRRKIPYIPLCGSLSERAAQADAVLARFRHCRSLGELLAVPVPPSR